ncbi:serine hydrolase domain-containing protein [candidate division KSB1 bacterium]
MKTRTVFLIIFIAVFSYSSAIAQDSVDRLTREQIRDIDRIFAHFNNNTPGAALAVAKGSEILYKQGYGMSNLEYDIPITPSSIFHVASVTKQFTAMCIVLLEQQGKLSADDDFRKYIPEAADFGETITIRHLVHHISGLRDQWNLFSLSGWRSADVKMQDDVINFVHNQKDLNFKPGEEYMYCNTGFTLLAEIVERVSGQTMRDFADEQIFTPLGMRNTSVHDQHRRIVKNRTYAYTSNRQEGYRISIPIFDTYGATSLFTTVEDLVLWADNFNHKRVGGESGLNRLLTKGKLNNGDDINYAFGIQHGTYKELRTIGHSGSDAGYRAQFTMYPDHNITVAVLSNVSNGNPGGLARQVADIILAEFIEEPEPSEQRQRQQRTERPDPPELSKAELEEYVGSYYSEELDVTFTIAVKTDTLRLIRRKIGESVLRIREKDVVSSGSTTFRFTRADSKAVDGFLVSTGRVRNLRFIKR